ncbi:MAG: type II toxin-antitoxin system PemK/MazF family toxin [Candidatus Nanopelagicales bacterium]|jgi:hypothetical protein
MGSVRVRLASLGAAARGRWYPQGTRRRREYRLAALALMALCVLGPLAAVAWILLARPSFASSVLALALGAALPFGALVAFGLLDRIRPGRAPWWKVLGALLLCAPAAAVGVVALLVGRGGTRLERGTVLWAEVPNDEDGGRTSKVRPVVVVGDAGDFVEARWVTSQDKSRRHDYVELTVADQRASGLDGVGHSTWLSTETRTLPRAALREPVGRMPAELLARRPR